MPGAYQRWLRKKIVPPISFVVLPFLAFCIFFYQIPFTFREICNLHAPFVMTVVFFFLRRACG
jgi:hypothetical protein